MTAFTRQVSALPVPVGPDPVTNSTRKGGRSVSEKKLWLTKAFWVRLQPPLRVKLATGPKPRLCQSAPKRTYVQRKCAARRRERACERALLPTPDRTTLLRVPSIRPKLIEAKKSFKKVKYRLGFYALPRGSSRTARLSAKTTEQIRQNLLPVYAQPRTPTINGHFYTPRLSTIFNFWPPKIFWWKISARTVHMLYRLLRPPPIELFARKSYLRA